LSRYFVTCQEGPQRIPFNYPVDITLRLQNQAIMAMYLKQVEGFSFLLQYGNEATSTVDPNLDTELEFTPEDIGQAIVPTAGKEAWE